MSVGGPERAPSQSPKWRVTYEIRSGVDIHGSVLGDGEVVVSGLDEQQAAEAAQAWIWDNNPYADERVDPSVVILEIEEEEPEDDQG